LVNMDTIGRSSQAGAEAAEMVVRWGNITYIWGSPMRDSQ